MTRLAVPLLVAYLVALAAGVDYLRDVRVAPPGLPAEPFAPADPPGPPADPALRDPFVTGSSWRAALRGGEPSRPPGARPTAAPPPEPPKVIGTLVKGGRRFAVTPGAIVAAGDRLGAYAVRRVDLDRVTLELDGRTLDVIPLSPAPVLSVAPSPAATGR